MRKRAMPPSAKTTILPNRSCIRIASGGRAGVVPAERELWFSMDSLVSAMIALPGLPGLKGGDCALFPGVRHLAVSPSCIGLAVVLFHLLAACLPRGPVAA